MEIVYIGIGTNLGNREENIETALQLLEGEEGVRVDELSPVLETEPEGNLSGEHPDYLNAVARLETDLSPVCCLETLQEIEARMGRTHKGENRPRVIDLDLLFYGDQIIEKEHFRVPHPDAHTRRFVLEPFEKLAPDFVHPEKQKTIRQLWTEYA